MNEEHAIDAIFSEVQRFRMRWVWVLILFVAAVFWFLAVEQFLLDNPFGENLMPGIILAVFWLLFGVGLPILFYFGGLHTEVRSDGVYVRFAPFHFSAHKLAFSDITHCEVRTYRAMREYGGWGIKYGKNGKSYTVSGNRGVQLKFTEGKPLLIGSQRAEELGVAIQAKLK